MFKKRIKARYGSTRGMIETIKHRILYFFGKYDDYKTINWQQVKRLVFVCKGNICRSAYAEAVAKAMKIEAISCGLDTHDGKSAFEKAILTALKKNISLSQHKTTKISSIELNYGDLFVVMEPSQAENVKKIVGNDVPCTLLGLWGSPVMPFIYDPFSANEDYFNNCFTYIENTIRDISRIVVNGAN